jgi:histidine phosphotransferase ChpT
MSSTHDALRLIELASARLWDDIGGLLGALDQALSQKPPNTPAFQTSALDTARTLAERLNLRRAAWGCEGETLSPARIQVLARGLPPNVAVDVSALDAGTSLTSPAGRIVLNLLLLAADSLPGGGTVVLAGTPDDLFVRIAGPRAAWPAGLALCLADETDARSALTEPRSLQMAMAALLAHAAGIRLSALLSPTNQHEPAILRLGG